MAVLIISFARDLHAVAVKWALEQKGVDCEIWDVSRFPFRQNISIYISNAMPELGAAFADDGNVESREIASYDVVWVRRLPKFTLDPELHEADQRYAEAECNRYFDGLRAALSADALWVNPPILRDVADAKLYQLRTAVKYKLRIPETLSTNDPNKVKNFYEKHSGQIIFKPFGANAWTNSEDLREYRSYTAMMTADQIENKDSIRAAPGIYQPFIRKSFEVRALYFGKSYIASRINSQEINEARVDWRKKGRDLEYVPHVMPDEISSNCFQFLNALGLYTASFDFIVNDVGDYIFMEINEAGQFLFPESFNRDIHLLDAFSEFLASANASFEYCPKDPVRLCDFRKTEVYYGLLGGQ